MDNFSKTLPSDHLKRMDLINLKKGLKKTYIFQN